MSLGLRQGYVLSPLLFIIYVNWMDELIQTDECVTIDDDRCKISLWFFADDFVLMASSESRPQLVLNGFAVACELLE